MLILLAATTNTYRGREEIGGMYLPSSAGAYTTTLLVMVDIHSERGAGVHQAGGGLSSGWADFSIMMECTPEVAIATVCTLCFSFQYSVAFLFPLLPALT